MATSHVRELVNEFCSSVFPLLCYLLREFPVISRFEDWSVLVQDLVNFHIIDL